MKTHPHLPRPSRSARLLRNALLLGILLAVMGETVGVPHLRLATNYVRAGSSRYFEHSRYLGPFGVRELDRSLLPEEYPLVAFVPPETKPSQWFANEARDTLCDIQLVLGSLGKEGSQ